MNDLYLLNMINRIGKEVNQHTHPALWEHFEDILNEKIILRESKPSKQLEVQDLQDVTYEDYPFLGENGYLVITRKYATDNFNCICNNSNYKGFGTVTTMKYSHITCFNDYFSNGIINQSKLLNGIKIQKLISSVASQLLPISSPNNQNTKMPNVIKDQMCKLVNDYDDLLIKNEKNIF